MKLRSLFLLLLVVGAVFSGCTGKKEPQGNASAPEEPSVAPEETLPDVAPVAQETIDEPDFDVEETVDLGELL
ncbi:MAG: hypothetical protein GXO65_03230 [Euryarchaeota archaeon]|nr:hypothetical protein [Euryarchaeota archaeon]